MYQHRHKIYPTKENTYKTNTTSGKLYLNVQVQLCVNEPAQLSKGKILWSSICRDKRQKELFEKNNWPNAPAQDGTTKLKKVCVNTLAQLISRKQIWTPMYRHKWHIILGFGFWDL